jgi:hypothetical protein
MWFTIFFLFSLLGRSHTINLMKLNESMFKGARHSDAQNLDPEFQIPQPEPH